MKKKLDKLKHAAKQATFKKSEPVDGKVPRITNKTVAEHREEVIGGARKYILPLQESKHKIVLFSSGLFVATVLGFFAYCTLALYRVQTSDTFLYRVTQVIPFPIARSGSQFIAYENYLFELRHYKHFYENQQELDFDSEAGQLQLSQFKRRALDKVVNDAYIKQLASDNDISITDQEVEDEIRIVREQNRLGNSEEVLEETLKKFWGWSVDDFKRSLRQQLLAEKVIATMDTEAKSRAEAALAEINSGADFGEVAAKYSDDAATKGNGGLIGDAIQKTNRDLPSETTLKLFGLSAGEVSDIYSIGYGLEIVKAIEVSADTVKAAHILINFKSMETFVNDAKASQPARVYISLPELEDTQTPS